MRGSGDRSVAIGHPIVGTMELIAAAGPDGAGPQLLFCENETNLEAGAARGRALARNGEAVQAARRHRKAGSASTASRTLSRISVGPASLSYWRWYCILRTSIVILYLMVIYLTAFEIGKRRGYCFRSVNGIQSVGTMSCPGWTCSVLLVLVRAT